MKALPNKLGELMRVALVDEAKAHRSPKYRVNMRDWHVPARHARHQCDVCLAGAVMAFSLDGSPEHHLEPWEFDQDVEKKMMALDSVRKGSIMDALIEMGSLGLNPTSIEVEDFEEKLLASGLVRNEKVTGHRTDRLQWRKDMIRIMRGLQRADV